MCWPVATLIPILRVTAGPYFFCFIYFTEQFSELRNLLTNASVSSPLPSSTIPILDDFGLALIEKQKVKTYRG